MEIVQLLPSRLQHVVREASRATCIHVISRTVRKEEGKRRRLDTRARQQQTLHGQRNCPIIKVGVVRLLLSGGPAKRQNRGTSAEAPRARGTLNRQKGTIGTSG